MARFSAFGTLAFTADVESVSGTLNTAANPTQRGIGVRVPSDISLGGRRLLGYCWHEILVVSSTYVRLSTLPLITDGEIVFYLPADLANSTHRVRYIPLEGIPAAVGAFRYFNFV